MSRGPDRRRVGVLTPSIDAFPTLKNGVSVWNCVCFTAYSVGQLVPVPHRFNIGGYFEPKTDIHRHRRRQRNKMSGRFFLAQYFT